MKNTLCVLISLFVVLGLKPLGACAAGSKKENLIFQTYYSTEPTAMNDYELIPIYIADVMPLNGIIAADALKFTETIKENLYRLMVFEIRELTPAGAEKLGKIIAEHSNDPAYLVELGKFLKVEQIVLIRVGKFSRNYSISLTLFNVRTGTFDKTLSKGCACLQPQMISVLKKSVRGLLGVADNSGKDTISHSTRGLKCPPQMKLIPGGKIKMGRNDGQQDERPEHLVRLKPFCLDINLIKISAYSGEHREYDSTIQYNPNVPAILLSYAHASKFCRDQGFRLPTEAEWENACRGPSGKLFPYGNYYRPQKCVTDTDNMTKVGAKEDCRSDYGIYDMSGQVWELTSSINQPYPYVAVDGREHIYSKNYRVLRGGSFRNEGASVSCTNRSDTRIDFKINFIGFRCASDPLAAN